VILASRSPQRRAILEQLGIAFSVVVPHVEELEQGPPRELALENARRKAAAVESAAGDDLVIGVDTVVCLGDCIYGKPLHEDDARRTLHALSGRRHRVISGLCLIQRRSERTAAATTNVQFRRLDEQLIAWYVASGEWRDRAGGYAIQRRGAALVSRIEGDYQNVVGLPVAELLVLEPGLLQAARSGSAPGTQRL